MHKSIKGRLVGAIGLLVVAAIVAVGSGANFTAHSANPGNMVTEGAFTINNDREGLALFAPQTNWDPTEEVSGQVKIGNSGTETGNFTVKGVTEAGNDDEFNKNVLVQIVDRAGSFTSSTLTPNGISYTGSLYNFIHGCTLAVDGPSGTAPKTMPNNPGQSACDYSSSTYNGSAWDLHNWNSGDSHYYTFRLINEAKDGNGNDPAVAAMFNKTAKFGIEWDAVSTA
jgi:hypothetical protein